MTNQQKVTRIDARRGFWGDRKPPQNRSDMFRVVRAAATPKSNGNTATLRIYGPIDSYGGWWGVSAKEVAQALDELDDDITTIQVRLNSPGGEAFEGIAIMNLLRAHKAATIAVVDGLAASAASVIATGCEELVMSPGTELMIHDASSFAYGDAAEMDKARRMLDSLSNTVASVYAAKAGGSTEDWRELMIAETWYAADEAVDAGLADRTDTVPDAGPTETAGTDPDPDPLDVEDMFDLSFFAYPGRSHAPAPAAIAAAHRPPAASADGSTQKEGAKLVDLTDEQIATLREQVGFPEDADADTIVAAVTEALEERADNDDSADEDGTEPTTDAATGMTSVPTVAWNQLQEQAKAGADAAEQLRLQRRKEVLDEFKDRFTPKARGDWEKAYDRDADGTRTLLAQLPVVVPTDELGHATSPDLDAAEAPENDPTYKAWRF